MHYWSYLHFFCFIVFSGTAIFILVKNRNVSLNRACAGFLGLCAIWSLQNIFTQQPYTTKETASLFFNIGSIGWAGVSSFFLWYALIFTDKKTLLKQKLTYIVLFVLPAVCVYKQWTGFLLVEYIEEPYGWSHAWGESLWPYFYYFYYISFSLLGLGMILIFLRKTSDLFKKKQSIVICIASCITLITATTTDVIFKRLNIHSVPLLGNVFCLSWAYGVIYAIVRYRFLSITPVTAAENIVETMSDPLILLDENAVITRVNNAASRFFGYDKRYFVGKTLNSFMANKSILTDKIAKAEPMNNYDCNFKSKNNQNVPAIISTSILRSENGAFVGTICIARDISDHIKARKAVEESEERFRLLFDRTPDAYYISDLKGVFIDGNKAAEEMTGYKKNELIGRSFLDLDLLTPDQIAKASILLTKNMLSRPTGPDRFILKHKSGTMVNVEVRTYPVKIQGKAIVLGIVRNVTKREKYQRELDKKAREIEVFHKSAVDRELKMVELKKKINKLEEELKKRGKG